jgi:hypothetical protein
MKQRPLINESILKSFLAALEAVKAIHLQTVTCVCDRRRHLVCLPYSIADLHMTAWALNIGAHFFHRDHYDIPKRRIAEIMAQCRVVRSRDIVLIIRGKRTTLSP